MQTIHLEDAVAKIPDGASLAIGGFMAVGTPERLIDELVRQQKRHLTVIANDTAVPGKGIGKLISTRLVDRVIASHIGLNPETQQQMLRGDLTVELVPQGTLIERIRAGGYGLGGVLTPTGVGTMVEEGKQKVEVNGQTYLVELALQADFALVHAFLVGHLPRNVPFLWAATAREQRLLSMIMAYPKAGDPLADYLGNLTYVLTARNFNPLVAMAGETVIACAEHIVPVGLISPDHVVTPAPVVDYLVTNREV